MDEPVGFDGNSISNLERMVEKRCEELSENKPEWVRNGCLVIPNTEYSISLEIVASCWHDGLVGNEHISIQD